MCEGTSTQTHKQKDTQTDRQTNTQYKTLKFRNTNDIYAEIQITVIQKYKFQKLELPVSCIFTFTFTFMHSLLNVNYG